MIQQIHAAGMAAAFKLRGQERLRDLFGHVGADDAGAHGQHVGVIMAAGHFGTVAVAAQGAADTADLVGSHGHTDAGSADHDAPVAFTGGYLLKQDILIWLEEHDYEFEDFGCYNTESVDYPVYAEMVARAVANGECDKGIVICTTGIGVSMAANKVKGIRCALCGDSYSAEMTRRHNNANVLAMGAGIIGPNMAKKITEVFLTTEFEGGRHARRVGLLDDIQP